MFKEVDPNDENQKQIMELEKRRQNLLKLDQNKQKQIQEENFNARVTQLTLDELEKTDDGVVTYHQIGRLYLKKPISDIKDDLKKTLVESNASVTKNLESRKTIVKRIQSTEQQIKELQKGSK